MNSGRMSNGWARVCALGAALLGLFVAATAQAVETICARVKIEIRQELTLERQAFDAHMRITNGLDTLSLQNVNVDVLFSDEGGNPVRATSNPSDTTAAFFIRIASMTGVDNVSGTGTLGPAATADINWLIIPAVGAANAVPSGKLYYVGAELTYLAGGEEQKITVSPDYIFVKPLPKLTLDYFLTKDVFADDPLTLTQIEPAVPFTLGVRVANNGSGIARNVSIESAQPKIIENEQGLLIDFLITGSAVNDQPATPSLLAKFGDIAPESAATGRWIMETTLSGEFVDMTATFTHADELGGELTSLIDAVNTHLLVKDVRVDAPGRDGVRDFLALDGEVLRAYESTGLDTLVTDQSALSNLQPRTGSGARVDYDLNTPPTAGLMYVKLPDPHNGRKSFSIVLRSDGKTLDPANIWVSQEKDANKNWVYYLNVFDANSTGKYLAVLEDNVLLPQPPVLQFIPDRVVDEGRQVSFIVEASDPNRDMVSMIAAPLPPGANFYPQGDGFTWIFDWTPAVGQAGVYDITYQASDGVLVGSRTARITVTSANDTDGDGLPDDWERAMFGNLDRDGTGDFDGDGISDLQEYLDGTDPLGLDGPSTPEIVGPADGARLSQLQPALEINNSRHPRPNQALSYEFEVFTDAALSQRLVGAAGVAPGSATTSWRLAAPLPDNQMVFWRVRAFDGVLASPWAYGRFITDTVDEIPTRPQLSYPLVGTQVGTVLPLLEVTNLHDPDPAPPALTYEFEIFSDVGLSNLVQSSGALPEGMGVTQWRIKTALTNGVVYHWRAVATQVETGLRTESAPGSFTVNTANSAPPIPAVVSPLQLSTVTTTSPVLNVSAVVDANGNTPSYSFELDTVPSFDSAAKRNANGGGNSWAVSGLVDNQRYYWRAKAGDGLADSAWVYAEFIVSTANEAPNLPRVLNPGDKAWKATRTPALALTDTGDPDQEALRFEFEIYSDLALSARLATASGEIPQWTLGAGTLADHTWFYWRGRAIDGRGVVSAWTLPQALYVNDDPANDPPAIALQQPAADVTIAGGVTLAWTDSDEDHDATIALYYDTDSSGADGVLIADGLPEDLDGGADRYTWSLNDVAPGTYFVYAVISDGQSAASSYARGAITVQPVVTRAELVVTPPQTLATTEAGGAVLITVTLSQAPTATVTVDASSTRPNEAVLSATQLMFTPDNWNLPQTLTVKGVNDCAVDGNQAYQLAFAPLQSTDSAYAGVQPNPLSLTNQDDDVLLTSPEFGLCRYQLISSTRSTRTEFDYVYKLDGTNITANARGFTATVSSTSSNVRVMDANIDFGNVAPGATVTSLDTITLRINRTVPFDPAVLVWNVAAPP